MVDDISLQSDFDPGPLAVNRYPGRDVRIVIGD